MIRYILGNQDITTKETIKAITYDIATYILNLKIDENIEFVDKELQRIEKREADIVALCKINNEEAILHLEIQNGNDGDMRYRMMRYYSEIKMQFKKQKIYQYVVYIGKRKMSMKSEVKDVDLNYKYNLIDMHTINCEDFIKIDTPDSLVLSVLCDFKDKDEIELLTYIIKRLRELTEDDNRLGKYMLILETLSKNRDLKTKLKEVEDMLRDIKYEDLPSYEIGMERGIQKGIQTGRQEGRQEGATNKVIEIAKNAISNGIDNETISKITGLSIKDIKKLILKL